MNSDFHPASATNAPPNASASAPVTIRAHHVWLPYTVLAVTTMMTLIGAYYARIVSHKGEDRVMLGIGIGWFIGVVTGSLLLLNYANSPGRAGSPPQQWPTSTGVVRSSDRPTLVMFVHPRCPCSRASVGELALLMAHCQGRVVVKVIFVKPIGASESWVHSDLWRSTLQIPEVELYDDELGTESERFGSHTSGDTVLYDARGQLQFHGGITSSRGHFGGNLGQSALQSFLLEGFIPTTTTPVFGCALSEQPMNRSNTPPVSKP